MVDEKKRGLSEIDRRCTEVKLEKKGKKEKSAFRSAGRVQRGRRVGMALGAWNGALYGVGCGKWRGLLAIAQAARRREIPQLLIFAPKRMRRRKSCGFMPGQRLGGAADDDLQKKRGGGRSTINACC